MTDWHKWLRRYDRPQSPHSRRLRTVRRLIDRHLDDRSPDPVTLLSICAGDGRDVIDTLAERDDVARVAVTLVERDPRLCALARDRAAEARLAAVRVLEADAGSTGTYADLPPADLLLLIGVFGNLSDAHVAATISVLPALCAPGALVIWSLRQQPRRDLTRLPDRHAVRNDRARVERIGDWLMAAGLEETFANRPEADFHVAAWRCGDRAGLALPPARRFFDFASQENESSTDP